MAYCSVNVPEALARQYGLSAGDDVETVARPDGILLRRSADQLTKLYVEVTAQCNLACEMCVRNAWNEPLG